MKKQKLMAVVLLTALTGLFVGCSDDDSDNCLPDYTGALTAEETAFSGKWVLSAVVAEDEVDLTDDEEDNPSTDIYAQQSECERDQQYNLLADRSFEYKNGVTAEDCDNPVTIKGTWKLGGSTLGLIANCFQNVIDLEFNSDETTFSYTTTLNIKEVDGNELQSEATFTYTKEPVVEETE